MCSRDRPKCGDQTHENAACRERVCKERNPDVSVRQSFGHNTGTNDACQQEGRSEGLRYSPTRKTHARAATSSAVLFEAQSQPDSPAVFASASLTQHASAPTGAGPPQHVVNSLLRSSVSSWTV